MTDNCACNLFELGGGVVTSTETCLMYRVDPDTLETCQKLNLDSLVNIASARALTDPKTKEVYNLAATFLTGKYFPLIKCILRTVCT